MLEIGNRKYTIPEPDGMRTWALQQRIIPVAGRVAAVFVSLIGDGAEMATLAEMDVLKVLPSALPHIGHIFSEMPPGELEGLTREMLRDATCIDERGNALKLFGTPGGDAFGSLMRGRTTEVWQLLWHALEVWYPDFFARVRALTGRTESVGNHSVVSSTSAGNGQVNASL